MAKKDHFRGSFSRNVSAAALGLTLIVLFFFGIGMRYNNRAAERLLEKLEAEVKLPPGSEVVETASWVGNRSGTGDHVELWAGLLIRYDGPKENRPETVEEILRDGWSERLFAQPPDIEAAGPALSALQDWDDWDYEQFPRMADVEDVFPALMEVESRAGWYILGVYGDAVTRWDIRGA